MWRNDCSLQYLCLLRLSTQALRIRTTIPAQPTTQIRLTFITYMYLFLPTYNHWILIDEGYDLQFFLGEKDQLINRGQSKIDKALRPYQATQR